MLYAAVAVDYTICWLSGACRLTGHPAHPDNV